MIDAAYIEALKRAVATPVTVGAHRVAAHDVFDRLWKEGHMTRTEAYRWMAKTMRLSKGQAHIVNFTPDQCRELIDKTNTFLASK